MQNRHFNLTTPWSKRGVRTGLEDGEGFDFSMQSIFWNNLFTGKNLLKQAKYFVPQIRIWHLGALTMQKLIKTELLWFSKYLKWLHQLPSPWNLRQSKLYTNGVKGKNGRVHPIDFCGWPSKIFHGLLKFPGNPFLHLPENLLLTRSFLLCLFKQYFGVCLTLNYF